jgi:hypothetical protein
MSEILINGDTFSSIIKSQKKVVGIMPELQKSTFGYVKFGLDIPPGSMASNNRVKRRDLWCFTQEGRRIKIIANRKTVEESCNLVKEKINKYLECVVKYA